GWFLDARRIAFAFRSRAIGSDLAMDMEHNLLFAVLALQLELIDSRKLADVCAGWAAQRDRPLAELLRERGWLSDDDYREVERLLQRKLKKHGGDARAGLRESLDEDARAVLLRTDHAEVRQSLDRLSSTERKRASERPTVPDADMTP